MSGSNRIVYTFTAPGTVLASFSTCDTARGDTVLYVGHQHYDDVGCRFGSYRESSPARLYATGQQVIIRVGWFVGQNSGSTQPSGDTTLSVTCTAACTSHLSCDGPQYCNSVRQCSGCSYCVNTRNDAYNSRCPEKCDRFRTPTTIPTALPTSAPSSRAPTFLGETFTPTTPPTSSAPTAASPSVAPPDPGPAATTLAAGLDQATVGAPTEEPDSPSSSTADGGSPTGGLPVWAFAFIGLSGLICLFGGVVLIARGRQSKGKAALGAHRASDAVVAENPMYTGPGGTYGVFQPDGVAGAGAKGPPQPQAQVCALRP